MYKASKLIYYYKIYVLEIHTLEHLLIIKSYMI